ncbi:MAG: septum site-determining protein MinC [Defluviitaleaceae bacterium]|nr:septum site-determining protein MinC [Defluviitaleaceae bacterium]
MAVKQIVTLKGQKDGISITLDENADFEEIKSSLRKKVSQGKNFFDDEEVKVTFAGRELDEYSEKILIDIISEETGTPVLKDTPRPRQARSDNRENVSAATRSLEAGNAPPPSAQHKVASYESPTSFHRSGLRSGQRIRYEGSVVIMGDANPGSEIIADGNVIVLGALKGMAHAGASGDTSCFVSALHLAPTQLRIAGTISFVPPGAAKSAPAYAYVKDGQVFIGPL